MVGRTALVELARKNYSKARLCVAEERPLHPGDGKGMVTVVHTVL